MVWEFVFMMLILKIPIVYLCFVVYWAVRGRAEAASSRLSCLRNRTGSSRRPPWSPHSRNPRRDAGPSAARPARARRAAVRR